MIAASNCTKAAASELLLLGKGSAGWKAAGGIRSCWKGEVKLLEMIKKYLSEFMGTFILVFCGTGAAIVNKEMSGVISHAGVAITFGLVVMVIIYTLGSISGAHINPAVTIAFTIARTFSVRQVLPYIVSQLTGAISASLLLKFLFPLSSTLGATLPAGSVMQSFVVEFFLTLFLMFVVIRASTGSKEKGIHAAVIIGAIVLLEAMFAGPVSGPSMNPARSFAPAIASGHLEHLWLYIVAPVVGAAAAIPVSNFFRVTNNLV